MFRCSDELKSLCLELISMIEFSQVGGFYCIIRETNDPHHCYTITAPASLVGAGIPMAMIQVSYQ